MFTVVIATPYHCLNSRGRRQETIAFHICVGGEQSQ